jgi:hypothetical protein
MSRGEFDHLDDAEVLQLLSRTMRELRDRELIRSENIVGDIGEALAATHFSVTLETGSNRHYDLRTREGVKVQVKSRRVTTHHPRVGHWSELHGVDEHGFEEFIGVVLNEDFSLREAWSVPWAAVSRLKQKKGTGYVLAYTRKVLNDDEVRRIHLGPAGGRQGEQVMPQRVRGGARFFRRSE